MNLHRPKKRKMRWWPGFLACTLGQSAWLIVLPGEKPIYWSRVLVAMLVLWAFSTLVWTLFWLGEPTLEAIKIREDAVNELIKRLEEQDRQRKADPDWQKYMELKKKFEV